MKDWVKNKPFAFGFIVGIFLIVLTNIYFRIVSYTYICFDCYLAIGFPFPVYERWAISRFEQFFWIAVFANIFITIIFSILIGWLFKFALLKFISKDVKQHPQNTFYNKAFKIGFWINILIFLLLNYYSYLTAYNEYLNRKIRFSADGYVWGFPFVIYKYLIGYPNHIGLVFEGIVLNIFIAVVCGFITGLIFKFIRSKFTSK